MNNQALSDDNINNVIENIIKIPSELKMYINRNVSFYELPQFKKEAQ